MKRILVSLAFAVPASLALVTFIGSHPVRGSCPIFHEDFGNGSVDSQFTALGDATITESGGLLHVDVVSNGGVQFTPSSSSSWAVSYKIIPHFASAGVGWIQEDQYVKENGTGTEYLGHGSYFNNATGYTYEILGDGLNNDVMLQQWGMTDDEPIEVEDEWEYDDIFGIPIGCYCKDHKIYWVPPAAWWAFGGAPKPRRSAVESFSNAKMSKLEIYGTDDFDLDYFTIDDSSLVTGYWTVSPRTGLPAGGTTVTLDAQGTTVFTGATAVKVGGVSASFTVVNSTRIQFTTPTHAAGEVNIDVIRPAVEYREYKGFKYQ